MNPNLNATLSSIRVLLIVLGSVLADQGLGHTEVYKWIMIASGAVMVVGPAVWAVWSSISNWHKAAAVGVAAGVNMALQGKALAADGVTVVLKNDGSTPPKPFTVATATEVVKDFAPAAPIAKA